MKAMVLYDSAFGNTKRVVKAIGTAFEPAGEVEIAGFIDSCRERDMRTVGRVRAAWLAARSGKQSRAEWH